MYYAHWSQQEKLCEVVHIGELDWVQGSILLTYLFWYFLLSDAAGSFSSADLSQLKEGMARMTGKVRISIKT